MKSYLKEGFNIILNPKIDKYKFGGYCLDGRRK